MANLFGVLPRISAEVAKITADPTTPKAFAGGDPRLGWLGSLREVQLACDRWAGRRFPTDAERVAFWEAHRGRPRADWLVESLGVVAGQADAGDPWAGWVAREVMPDLPDYNPAWDRAAGGEPAGTGTGPGVYARWLAKNRPRLRYDPESEVFRLK